MTMTALVGVTRVPKYFLLLTVFISFSIRAKRIVSFSHPATIAAWRAYLGLIGSFGSARAKGGLHVV